MEKNSSQKIPPGVNHFVPAPQVVSLDTKQQFWLWVCKLFGKPKTIPMNPDPLASPLFFPLVLVKWRIFLMLTKEEASRLLCISRDTYRRWEEGQIVPDLAVRKAVIEYINSWVPKGLTLDDVVEEIKNLIEDRKIQLKVTDLPVSVTPKSKSKTPKESLTKEEQVTEIGVSEPHSQKPRRQVIMEKIIEFVRERKVSDKTEIHTVFPYMSHIELTNILLTMVSRKMLDRTRTSSRKYIYWVYGDEEGKKEAQKHKSKIIAI